MWEGGDVRGRSWCGGRGGAGGGGVQTDPNVLHREVSLLASTHCRQRWEWERLQPPGYKRTLWAILYTQVRWPVVDDLVERPASLLTIIPPFRNSPRTE